jgi:hypothetical protein
MRRVFTHLNSRLANDSFHPWRKAFSLEDPVCPTLVEMSKQQAKQQKFGPTSPGVGRDFLLFYLFILFISLIRFINSIQFNYVTYVP